jgi:hypothetical protein
MAGGALHACLEVWPSGHAADIEEYIETDHAVQSAGPLGVVGKIGWYVPTYMVAQHPELVTWEGFTDPDNAALFRMPATGSKGQFLAGDPTCPPNPSGSSARSSSVRERHILWRRAAAGWAGPTPRSRMPPPRLHFWVGGECAGAAGCFKPDSVACSSSRYYCQAARGHTIDKHVPES